MLIILFKGGAIPAPLGYALSAFAPMYVLCFGILGLTAGITSSISFPSSAYHLTIVVYDSLIFSDNDNYSDNDDNNIKYSLTNGSTVTSNDEQSDSENRRRIFFFLCYKNKEKSFISKHSAFTITA